MGNNFALFQAAHEHYSIDVFVAFYISSRLFLYYHTLANSKGPGRVGQKAWFYFPLFYFFESNVDGRVPNEFGWPVALADLRRVPALGSNCCCWLLLVFVSKPLIIACCFFFVPKPPNHHSTFAK